MSHEYDFNSCMVSFLKMLRKCWYVQDMALSVIATLRKDGWGVLGVWGGGLRFAVVCFLKALSR